ncbi:MAG: hypothetical protein COC01_09560, partial [Bacteroidetes bacterium]
SQIVICEGDSALIYSVYQSTAGTYYNTLTNINACDSVIITNLTVNPTYSMTDPAIAICNGDSISIYGTFRSVAGTYYDSLLTVNGCDSVHSTVLTVNPTYSISDPDVAICNGDSVSIYGTFRSLAATYYDSSTTTNGCDSVRSTILTVNQLPTVNLGADTMICNGCSITLDAGGGFTSYAWSIGDTTQTIIVDSANAYSVIVTDANGCTGGDTIVIDISIGINPQSSIHNPKLDVYPNPNTGEFTVTFKIIEKQHINLKVFDIKGQVIYEENLSGFIGEYQNKIDMSSYAKGIYSLQLSTKENTINKKIILE